MSESEIIAHVMKLTTETERIAYLDSACAGNPQVRAALEALLHAQATDPVFLDQAAGSPGETADLPPAADSLTQPYSPWGGMEATGMVIAGRYQLLEVIGEGGMGTVYLAQQTEPVKRLVAVKLIKAGMDSRQVVARFEAERQALALMDHPNIAKVLDGGTTSGTPDGANPGRPFFVMELVKGIPIAKYCDEHRLTLRQRLGLFIPVCQAIQHAHQKGIIHRDLKPSNVLVARYDEKPVPKVIDFGVAKATGQQIAEDTLHTGFGAVVGTVEYMSPEQSSFNQLDVDTRSDIYSLGVVLYELLAGSPPFSRKELEKAGMLEILRVIREQDPPKPSAKLSSAAALPTLAANRGTEPKRLTALVRGELDWIIMKALEKDRSRRYETANGLALDLERYLRDEPVAASPPSASYRIRKFLRRHRGAVTAVALVVLALISGIIGTSWGMFAANEAWHSEAKRAEAETRARAEAQEHAAIAKAVNDFFNELLIQADVSKQTAKGDGKKKGKGPDKGRDRDVTVRTLLDRASKNIKGKFADAPLVEAAIRLTIGQAYTALAEFAEAEPHLQQAIALRTAALGPEHQDTLESKMFLGVLYSHLGKPAQAGPLFEEVVHKRTAALGPAHPATIKAKHHLAKIYMNRHRWDQAEALFVEIIGAAPPDMPARWQSKRDLAELWLRRGKLDQAEQLFQEIMTELATKGDDHPDLLGTQTSLACVYIRQGKFKEAEELFDQLLKKSAALLPPGHPDTVNIRFEQAKLLLGQDQPGRAATILDDVIELLRDKLGREHGKTIAAQEMRAKAHMRQEEFDRAEALLLEILEGDLAAREPDHPELVKCKAALGHLYLRLGKLKEAEPLLEAAREAYGLRYPPEYPPALKNKEAIGILCLHQGKGERAEALFRECLTTYERTDAEPWQLFFTKSLVGASLLAQKRYADAEAQLLQSHEGMTAHQNEAPAVLKHQMDKTVEWIIALYEARNQPGQVRAWRAKLPLKGSKKKKANPRQGSSQPQAAIHWMGGVGT